METPSTVGETVKGVAGGEGPPLEQTTGDPSGQTGDEEVSTAQPADAQPAPVIKHDWYQTQSDVYLDFMATVKLKLTNDREYTKELVFPHTIVPSKSICKVLGTKVELKMRKTSSVHWNSLEKSGVTKPKPKQFEAQGSDDGGVHKYPSSSHHTRDWDKLVATMKKEEKEEKLEGDAALNKLFQQIYSDGSEEVQRAMNKSFVESGGTVLSTNWKEVGQNPVERKPPDGMEWKEYEN